MSVSSLSTIMEEQIADTLLKVNYLMSQVNESMSAVGSAQQFLPVVSDILVKLQCVVSHQLSAAINTNHTEELWWDSSPEMVTYNESDNSDSDTSFMSTSKSLFSASFSSLSEEDEGNIFIKNISTFPLKAAPSGIFSRRKSKRRRVKKMRRLVHPDLYNIWYYSGQIASPPDVKSKPVSVPPYPQVDWTNVNKRFLGNIPNPSFFPIHGCSEDPSHYELTYVSHNNFIPAEFERPCPFGQAYGYMTERGVIAVPDRVHHGYVWSVCDSGVGQWVLSVQSRQTPKKQEGSRGRGRKKKKFAALPWSTL